MIGHWVLVVSSTWCPCSIMLSLHAVLSTWCPCSKSVHGHQMCGSALTCSTKVDRWWIQAGNGAVHKGHRLLSFFITYQFFLDVCFFDMSPQSCFWQRLSENSSDLSPHFKLVVSSLNNHSSERGKSYMGWDGLFLGRRLRHKITVWSWFTVQEWPW